MKNRLFLLLFTYLLVFSCNADIVGISSSEVGRKIVPLTVNNNFSFIKPTAVQLGVPIPMGELFNVSHSSVLLNDEEIPFHREVLAYWPDKSIKSIMVRLLLTSDSPKIEFIYGNKVQGIAKANNFLVKKSEGFLFIHNDDLHISISRKTGLIDSIGRDANGDKRIDALERIISKSSFHMNNIFDGKTYSANHLSDVTAIIESMSSSSVVIRADGYLQNGGNNRLMKYRIRYYVDAGDDSIDIDATVIDDRLENPTLRTDELAVSVSSYGFDFYYNQGISKYEFGLENSKSKKGDLFGSHNILQEGEFVFIDGSDKGHRLNYSGVSTGGRAPGWMSLSGDHQILVNVKDFWQNFPNELAVDKEKLSINLHPEDAVKKPFATHHVKYDKEITKQYTRPDTFYFTRKGGAKTSKLQLSFPKDKYSTGELVSINNWYQLNDLKIRAEFEWYYKSEVFGKLKKSEAESQKIGFDASIYNNIYQHSFKDPREANSLATQYGWRDYGDRLRPGWAFVSNGVKIPSFYNDTHLGSNSYFKQFLRTQNVEWFRIAKNATNHFIDIDVSHSPRKGYWKTKIPSPPGEIHAISHEMIDHQTRNLHLGHAHISGITDYYLLTGDRRTFDVFTEIEGWWKFMTPYLFEGTFNSDNVGEAERDYAWPLYVMNEVVRVTGDFEFHNKVSGRLINYLIQWFNEPQTHIGYNPITNVISNDPIGISDSRIGTGYWIMGRMDNYGSFNKANGTNPWMAAALLSNIVDYQELDSEFAASGLHSRFEKNDIDEMYLQALNFTVKHGYDKKNQRFAYSEVVRKYSGGSYGMIYPLFHGVKILAERNKIDPSKSNSYWYDTHDEWEAIYKYHLKKLKSIKVGSNTVNTGFYGYEIIFPIDVLNDDVMGL